MLVSLGSTIDSQLIGGRRRTSDADIESSNQLALRQATKLSLHKMTSDTATSNIPEKDTNQTAPSDSDSEREDIFHDARFPAKEEAVSCFPPPVTALDTC